MTAGRHRRCCSLGLAGGATALRGYRPGRQSSRTAAPASRQPRRQSGGTARGCAVDSSESAVTLNAGTIPRAGVLCQWSSGRGAWGQARGGRQEARALRVPAEWSICLRVEASRLAEPETVRWGLEPARAHRQGRREGTAHDVPVARVYLYRNGRRGVAACRRAACGTQNEAEATEGVKGRSTRTTPIAARDAVQWHAATPCALGLGPSTGYALSPSHLTTGSRSRYTRDVPGNATGRAWVVFLLSARSLPL